MITDDKNIATCFNQYFSTIDSKLADNIQGSDSQGITPEICNSCGKDDFEISLTKK